jgi:hypothetical protein
VKGHRLARVACSTENTQLAGPPSTVTSRNLDHSDGRSRRSRLRLSPLQRFGGRDQLIAGGMRVDRRRARRLMTTAHLHESRFRVFRSRCSRTYASRRGTSKSRPPSSVGPACRLCGSALAGCMRQTTLLAASLRSRTKAARRECTTAQPTARAYGELTQRFACRISRTIASATRLGGSLCFAERSQISRIVS